MKELRPQDARPGSQEPACVEEKKLLLYVEDEEHNRNVAQLRLGSRYRLLLASNDQEACALVRAHQKAIHAVLMDIQLQGSTLDGVRLTRLLRGRLPGNMIPPQAANVPILDVPILFVTAYGTRYSEAFLEEAGADGIVSKPVDFTALNLALARLYLAAAARSFSRIDSIG